MMLQSCFGFAALALVLLPSASSLYSAGGPVKVLTAANFKTAILDSDVPAVVEFYAPWCGHCQQLSPTYTRVAENLHGIVTVGAVDCDVESNKPLCGQYGIQGFPTLKTFPGDKPKSGRKSASDYQGPRAAKAIADAATAGLHAKLIQRPGTLEDFKALRGSSAAPVVALFTDKPKTTTLFKSLSMRFRGRLTFAQIADTKGAIASTYDVSASPTLIVIPTEGEPATYDGKLKAKDLVDFLKGFAGPKGGAAGRSSKSSNDGTAAGARSSADGKNAGGKAGKPFAEEAGGPAKGKKQDAESGEKAEAQEPDSVSAVVDLDAADLAAVLEEDDAWLLGVHAGESGPDCTKEDASLARLAVSLGGMAKVGRVNATAFGAEALSELGLEAAAPLSNCGHALVLKPWGEQSEPEEAFPVFSGNATTKAVTAFVAEGFPAGAVAPVADGQAMEAFLNADGGSSPRVLLFTNKDAPPPLFRALAANLQSAGALFGVVHERETEILANFKVAKVPTMVVAWVAPVEQKDAQGRPLMGAKLQAYSGPLRYAPMTEFLRFMFGIIAAGDDSVKIAAAGSALVAHTPQANTTADFQQLCTSKRGLCVIGLLNPATSEHEQKVHGLGIMAMKHTGQPLHFLWVDARRQAAFAKAFGLTPGSAPTAVVLSPRQKRFVALQGGLAQPQPLDALLTRVLAGRERTTPLEELPVLDDSAAAAHPGTSDSAGSSSDAAGGAAAAEEEPPVEDEFDLADLMAEEIEDSSAGGSKAERLAAIDAQLKAEAEEKRIKQEAEAASAAKAAAAAQAERRRKAKAAAAAAAAATAAKDEL